MKRMTAIKASVFMRACDYARENYRVSINPGKGNATAMLPSTFWWHFYLTELTETNLQTTIQYQFAKSGVTGNQTNSCPMRKT